MKNIVVMVLFFLIAAEWIGVGFYDMNHAVKFAPWSFMMGGYIFGLTVALVIRQIINRKKQ